MSIVVFSYFMFRLSVVYYISREA